MARKEGWRGKTLIEDAGLEKKSGAMGELPGNLSILERKVRKVSVKKSSWQEKSVWEKRAGWKKCSLIGGNLRFET